MAKKTTAIAPRTPEIVAELTSRAQTLTQEIHPIYADTEKGFLKLAPLMAEVRGNTLYTLLGYKNIDEYARYEHGMSHGTVVGLNKVYERFGSTSDDKKTYRIPEQYLQWGYTKLLLFANDAKNFEEAGIDPLTEFKPEMTIKEMTTALTNALVLKAKEQEDNAIDTTATEVDKDSKSVPEADKASATATAEARKEDFNTYLVKVKQSLADLSAYTAKEPQEIITVVDTLLGYVKTLEQTYNKVHATATPKKSK